MHAAPVKLRSPVRAARRSALGAVGCRRAAARSVRATPQGSACRPWVYILRCADGSLYTGWTVDLERRLRAHAAGTASRYTRSRLPGRARRRAADARRGAARREEARIKRLSRAAKLELLARSETGNERAIFLGQL